MQGRGVLWFVWTGAMVSVACGGGPITAMTSGSTTTPVVTPRAPTCEYDQAWDEQYSQREHHSAVRLLLFAGKPAYVTTDQDRRTVLVRHLDTDEQLATLALPLPQGVRVSVVDVMETSDGPLIFATGAQEPCDGELALTTSYWLVQFDRQGRASPPITLPLPSGFDWESSIIAVGDYRVALLTVPRDPPEPDAVAAPEDNHIVIIDKRGNIVRSLRDRGVRTIWPVGDSAFASLTTSNHGAANGSLATGAVHERVRVFDLKHLAWVGPGVTTDNSIGDALPLAGLSVVLGAHPAPASRSVYSLATLKPDGTLSAWKPLGITGSTARMLRAATPGLGLVVTVHEEAEGCDDEEHHAHHRVRCRTRARAVIA